MNCEWADKLHQIIIIIINHDLTITILHFSTAGNITIMHFAMTHSLAFKSWWSWSISFPPGVPSEGLGTVSEQHLKAAAALHQTHPCLHPSPPSGSPCPVSGPAPTERGAVLGEWLRADRQLAWVYVCGLWARVCVSVSRREFPAGCSMEELARESISLLASASAKPPLDVAAGPRLGSIGAIFIMLKSALGAGLLNFPWAFERAGGIRSAVTVELVGIFLTF